MKIKTFILTFLLMSCPFLFGQSHWDFNEQNVYPNSMGILAKVSVNSTPLEDYELGAFVNGELRGSNQLEEGNNGFVFLSIHGNGNETVTLKAYDKNTGVTYENVYTINFNSNLNNSAINIDVVPVAQVGSEKVYYTKLSDALAAANDGETLTFLADITEDVTVNKTVTIDGAGKTYTGHMGLTNKKDITIKNVNFDGKGYNGYAVETLGAYYLTIEDCTAKNYGYGFVQTASGTVLTTVKNVTVSNMNYGVKVDYSNAVVIENADITVGVAAVLNSNYGEKTITIKNSDLNILGTWTRNNTTKTTYVFEGDNSIDSFITDAAIDNFKLALGATLTAPEGLTVTANADNAENYVVVYKDGKYSLFNKISSGTWGGIDWTFEITNLEDKSGTLTIAPTKGKPVPDENAPTKRTYKVGEWREAVVYNSKGSASAIGGYPYDVKKVKKLIIEEGVTKIGSFTAQFPNLTGKVVIPSTVTYIGQEAFHKAPMTSLVFAAGGTEPLCIANGAFKKTSIEEVSFPGDREYIHIHHWAFGGSANLKQAYIPANVTKSWGGEHVDYFDNFNSQTNVTWKEYGSIFTGCTEMETITFETLDARNCFFTNYRQSTADDYIVAAAGLVAYNTFEEAYAQANEEKDLFLAKDITLNDTWTIDKNLTINGNGKTLTYEGSDRAIDIPNNANAKVNVTIKNLAVAFSGDYCERGINYNDNGELTLEKVIVNKAGKNVTYALNLPGSSDDAKVVIKESSSLTGNIALNVWGENMTINAQNSSFISVDNDAAENYAAIVFNNNGEISCAGTKVSFDGGLIQAYDQKGNVSTAVSNAANIKFEEKNNYSIDENNPTKIIGYIKSPVALVIYADADQFYSCYSLQEAINTAAGKANATVFLLSDIEVSEIVKIESAVVIDLNGKTITSTAKKAFEVCANATIKNGTIIAKERAVDTRKNVELALNNVSLSTTGSGNTQPLTIGGYDNGTKVTLTDVNINAGNAGYGIITFVKTELTATNSTIGGYNALYVKPGSDNSTFNFINSTLSGSTVSNDVEGNSFSTIALRANNVTVTVDANSTVKSSGNYHHAISLGGKFEDEETTSGNKVTIKGTIEGNIVSNKCINANTVKVNENYITVLNANGYATIEAEENLVTVCEAVAKITNTNTYYATLSAAVEAATDGQTIELLWSEGDAPIAMNASLYGKYVTITGTAKVDWSKGFLFVGRGGKGNATLTFDNANLTSASNSSSYGIHVSGREKNTNNKYDGTVVIKNSTIELDYLINRGTMTLDGANLTVKNGFGIAGRPASETENNEKATATITLNNASNLVVNNHNGMGLGQAATILEGFGVMNINSGSTFETTQAFTVSANGTMNNAGTVIIAGTLTNNGTINLTDVDATLKATEGLTIKSTVEHSDVAYLNGQYYVVRGSVAYRADVTDKAEREGIAINIKGARAQYSLVVEVYNNETKLFTSTLIESKFPVVKEADKNYTSNIVLWGNPSSSWDNVIHVEPTEFNVPNIVKIFADEKLVQEYKHESDIFGVNLEKYLALDCVKKAVAKVGDSKYLSLAAAVDACPNEGTVTVLRDATGAGVVIDKDITIDFNGFTYSFNEGVGSTSTESNGFQIIKGKTVTLKNGTLDVAAEAKEKFYILVQNYADLNVTNMTLDGTNLDKWSTTDGDSYVLSNNSGTVNIEGTTIIANDEGNKAFAFDVCDHKSYQGGTTVNVANTENRETVVIGKIEVTGEGDADLNISGGLFTTVIQEAWCAEGYVPTNKFVDGKEYYTVTGKQTFKLAQHWNWFSSYLNIELSQLQTALGTSGKEIKHNDNTTSYEEGYWLTAGNPLTSVEASKMYMIQTSVAIDIELTGEVVDPSEVNITLQNNWNWIGYPLANPYTVKEVMAASNLEPKDGDQIKSHLDGFAQYMVVEGIGGNWYGTLKTMKPGCGYMYGNNNGGVRTLTFAYPNVNPSTRGTVEANITAENNHWAPTAQFASNMTMIATLGADSENYELAAFVNGEVRGSARPIYVEALDAYMFFLTIHGEGVEEVTFKCYDIDTDTEYTLNEGIVYSSDAILGSVREPYVLRGTLGMDEVSANEVAIYPNPTTTANEIMLSTTCDKVEVFNSLGVKVAEYQNVDTIEALETAGVYVIRVTNNDNVQNCRLVVK